MPNPVRSLAVALLTGGLVFAAPVAAFASAPTPSATVTEEPSPEELHDLLMEEPIYAQTQQMISGETPSRDEVGFFSGMGAEETMLTVMLGVTCAMALAVCFHLAAAVAPGRQ